MMYDGFGGWWWGMGLVHGLLWLVFLGLGIVVLARLVARETRPANGGGGAAETALDILKKRYARGEIDKPEFDAKRKDLAE